MLRVIILFYATNVNVLCSKVYLAEYRTLVTIVCFLIMKNTTVR